MSHPGFSEGDSNIGISHTMLVDRLQYLPGNQIGGNQTVMVRAILDDDASTNLVAHIFVLGSEAQNENDPGGDNSSFIVTTLSLVVVLLIGLLTLSVIRLRQKDMDEYEFEDETNISGILGDD